MDDHLVFYSGGAEKEEGGPRLLLSTHDVPDPVLADYQWEGSKVPRLNFQAIQGDCLLIVNLWLRHKKSYVFTGKVWVETSKISRAVASTVEGVKHVHYDVPDGLLCEAADSVDDLETLAEEIATELAAVGSLITKKVEIEVIGTGGKRVKVGWKGPDF